MTISDNTVADYQKNGITARASKNNWFDNERDQYNFEKGGGRFQPPSSGRPGGLAVRHRKIQ